MDLQIISDSHRGAYARRRMAEFADRCRQGGLAVTPQRLAIIQALLATTDHPHISLATVHRTLETLCQIGEARKVTMLHDSARYDGNLAPHHHVVCVRCRRIRDVEISGLDRVIDDNAALKGFRPLGWSLEIQALCDSCRKPKQASEPHRPGRRLALK
jgi:Fur family peroxide stress response transcriptional regulator